MRAKQPLEVRLKKEAKKREKLELRKALETKGRAKRLTRREKEAVFLRLHAAEFEEFSRQCDLDQVSNDLQLLATLWADSSASEEAKIELLRSLPEWPHAVLCLYEEAFDDAKQLKKADRNGATPKDYAYGTVGEALSLSEHRVHALAKEGRRYRRQHGPAVTLRNAIDAYDQRFNIGLSQKEKTDLANFLDAPTTVMPAGRWISKKS